MADEQQATFLTVQDLQCLLKPFHSHSSFKIVYLPLRDPKELNGHHPEILESPLRNRAEFFFRFLIAKSLAKVLKGHPSMLTVQDIKQSSHLPPYPEADRLRQKIDEEAECLQQKVGEISEQ